MMACRVLLFAQLAEALGAREVALELDEGATVGAALDRLAAEHDAVRAIRGQIAVAVDERYVDETAIVNDGATIALIPPVSGG